ncbi:MAG: MarR family winged helix-turn-helix transcriptional regulator [Pseudonocardia sp.]|nr:MarR family winged helix-turn-helix transcriptional regulator [Pseudonocardia sp.]
MRDGGGGPALFRLVRFWSRRWARGVAVDGGEEDTAVVTHVLAVNAIDSCLVAAQGGDGGTTVGEVARRLGLDQSGASRMVAAAVGAGYVERGRAPSDTRRAVLRLTRAGHGLIVSSERWQQGVFEELTAEWDELDRERFAGYLRRLARQVDA